MNLDDWVDLVKMAVGAAELKAIGVAFLREHFGHRVQYTDGTGDGGVDAWVVLQSEPRVRAAAQFHAGKSEPWDKKLADDLVTFCAYRDSLAESDPARRDFDHLTFVCTQTPSATAVALCTRRIRAEHAVSVEVFDARAIASAALQNKGEMWRLLASLVPGYDADSRPRSDAREEAILALSFFHDDPRKFRRAVAKSAVATVLHQRSGECERAVLLAESARLLRVSIPSKLVEYALRDLSSERLVESPEDPIRATAALKDSTGAALALAANDKAALHSACVATIEPLVPKGTHHRADVARRTVDAVMGHLGVLVQYPIAEEVLFAVDPSKQPRTRYERDAFKRWKATANLVAVELGRETGQDVLDALVAAIARHPFATRLASAELFLRLTEHDAEELERALSGSSQRVLLDTTIALPMMCALFDEPVPTWRTSFAARELYRSLKARGARPVIASAHLEEIASHLLKARELVDAIEADFDLSRSENFFVAHFCSLRTGSDRTRAKFQEFLRDFGGPHAISPLPAKAIRGRVEQSVRSIVTRYDIEIEDVSEFDTEDPLSDEPPRRDPVLLRHDRAVVSALQRWSKRDDPWLVCSADAWLRGALNERAIVALDSVGLADLLELVRPTDVTRTLLSPIDLASSIHEQAREAAAPVNDAIAQIEGPNLRDRDLVRKAASFRDAWIAGRRDGESDVGEEWKRFRDAR
jgi:hypothetical protein